MVMNSDAYIYLRIKQCGYSNIRMAILFIFNDINSTATINLKNNNN